MPGNRCYDDGMNSWRFILVILLLAVVGTAVRAEPSNEAQQQGYRLIMLSIKGNEDASRGLTQAIESQMSDLPVSFSVEWVDRFPDQLPDQLGAAGLIAREKQASAVFWCDLTRGNQVFLYLAESGKGRILVRQLEQEEGGTFEAVAIIVRSLVAALIQGGEIGVRAASPPGKPIPETSSKPSQGPSRPSPATPEKRKWLEMELGYAFVVPEPDQAAHGLRIGLSGYFEEGWYAQLGYVLFSPLKSDTETARIEVWRHPVFLGLGYLWESGRLSLGGSVALVVDYTVQETTSVKDAVLSPKGNDDLILSALPLFDIGVAFLEGLGARLGLGAEIPFNRVRYIDPTAAGSKGVLGSWPVQPTGTLGLWVTLY